MLKATSVKNYMRSTETVNSVRFDFILAIIPIIIWSIASFGLRTAILIVTSTITVVLCDIIVNLIYRKKLCSPSLYIIYCGILFALTLYNTTSILLCITGAALIPLLAKLFGGEVECHFFVPLLSRELAILFIPNGLNIPDNLPISNILNGTIPDESLLELTLGLREGMLGSISILAILWGALYLVFRKAVDFKTSTAYILVSIALSFAYPAIEARGVESVIYELITGDILFVAFFVLTDFNTTPKKASYRYLKGAICAVITYVLKNSEATFNAYLVSIIIVDTLSPQFSKLFQMIKNAKESKSAK